MAPPSGPSRAQVTIATPPPRSAAETPTALPRSPRRGGGRRRGRAGELSAYRAAQAGEGTGGLGGYRRALPLPRAPRSKTPPHRLSPSRDRQERPRRRRRDGPAPYGHVGSPRHSAKAKLVIKGGILKLAMDPRAQRLGGQDVGRSRTSPTLSTLRGASRHAARGLMPIMTLILKF